MTDLHRRRFLQTISIGAILSTAGCTDILNSPTNPNNDDGDDSLPGRNQTTVIERPENGYIKKSDGNIRWSELENAEPIEYVWAAREAYGIAQNTLIMAFKSIRDVFDALEGNNPNFEEAKSEQTRADKTTKIALHMHKNTIELLSEINETEAIKVVENNQDMVQDLQTLVTDLDTFITKYENGDMEYVAEHDSKLHTRYTELKNKNTYWSGIQMKITTTRTTTTQN